LGHQDACRHAHEHRCGRHNTRKFLHPKPPVLSGLTSEIVNVIRRPAPCNLAVRDRLWATTNVPQGATFQFTLLANADAAS
jgi:hypothetical protein